MTKATSGINDIVGAIKPYLPVKPDVRYVPIDEARHKMGPYADALALDQVVRSPRAPRARMDADVAFGRRQRRAPPRRMARVAGIETFQVSGSKSQVVSSVFPLLAGLSLPPGPTVSHAQLRRAGSRVRPADADISFGSAAAGFGSGNSPASIKSIRP